MTGRSFRFSHAIVRRPARSVAGGLRASAGVDPDPDDFAREHEAYCDALESAGVAVTRLEPLEAFPDSVFVEDAALCVPGAAIVLRPGAPSRFGEADAIRPALADMFRTVIDLPGPGFVDGGDILLTDTEALVGLSDRTDRAGVEALAERLQPFGYRTRIVETPPGVLHFKTDCGILDSETVFATARLAASGCFGGYRVVVAPAGEEAAANLIRVNERIIMADGFPKTRSLLADSGFQVTPVAAAQAARIDGGVSCMSLRFSP